MEIYRVTKKSLSLMDGVLPEIVKKRYWDPGCYTIGAVIDEGDRSILVGVCQFIIGSTKNGNVFAGISYIYVYSDYRLMGVGEALMERIFSILKEVGVSFCISILMKDNAGALGYRVPAERIEGFLEAEGFVYSKEAYTSWPDAMKYIFNGIPGISVTDPRWYIKRIAMGV